MSRLTQALILVAFAVAGAKALAAPAVPEIPDNWYDVEVLIFLRTDGAPTDEELLTEAARRYSANLTAPVFADDANPGGGYAPELGVAEPYPEADPNADALGAAPEIQPEQPPGVEQPSPVAEPAPATDEAAGGPGSIAAGVQPQEPAPPPSAREQLEQQFSEALADYRTTLEADAYRWRDAPSALSLTAAANALARRGLGQVLVHGAWRQPVPDREAPLPILIQSNVPVADLWQVEGTLAVTRGRFLHVDAELWFQPSLADNASSREERAARGVGYQPIPAAMGELPYELLSEHRRMRSGELHYLDHPTFGVLIQVTPVEPPATLTELLENLEESVE